MQKPVYNPETKKFMSPAEAKEKAAADTRYIVNIGQTAADKLVACAVEDGIDIAADTDIGRKVRQTNAIKLYLEQAIKEFLAARQAAGAE